MSDPTAAFLEGLVGESGGGGFRGGYQFRETSKERRRRQQIEDELRRYRAAEAERRARAGALEEAQARDETGLAIVPSDVPRTRFDAPAFGARPTPAAPERILGLRRDVGAQLGGVRASFDVPPPQVPEEKARIRFGGVERVGTPRAVTDELGYDPQESTGSLEGDIARSRQPTTAQLVGRTMGGFAGRTDLTPIQETLLGRGAVPSSALQPKRYAPTTREEWLRDQRDLAGLRAGSRATRDDLTAVERQIDDVRAELAAAERRKQAIPGGLVTPQGRFFSNQQQEKAYNVTMGEAEGEIENLRQRQDSLNTVRDEIAASLQGDRRPAPRNPAKTPAQWVTDVRREHPDWTPEQVAAEARRRAGVR